MTGSARAPRSPGLDITVPENLEPPDWDTTHAARLTICAHARDAAEARDVLAVLGLLPDQVDTPTASVTSARTSLAVMGRPDHPSGPLRGRVLA